MRHGIPHLGTIGCTSRPVSVGRLTRAGLLPNPPGVRGKAILNVHRSIPKGARFHSAVIRNLGSQSSNECQASVNRTLDGPLAPSGRRGYLARPRTRLWSQSHARWVDPAN